MTQPDLSVPAPASTTSRVAQMGFVTLAAGIVAALITWAAAESLMVDETGTGTKGGRERVMPVVHSKRNAAVSLGLLGGTLALSLGVAGGLLRRSAPAAAGAGLLGALLGIAAGAGVAQVLIPVYFSHPAGLDMMFPLLIRGGLWLPISIAAGLAFGLGLGGPRNAREGVVYAMVGSVLATISYVIAGVWLFPSAQTDRPLAMTPDARVFANLVFVVLVGLALTFGLSRSSEALREPRDNAA